MSSHPNNEQNRYWIGVDLDGTLAQIDFSAPYDPLVIGPPVPLMVARVKKWLAQGRQVKIVTARVSQNAWRRLEAYSAILDFIEMVFGEEYVTIIGITAEKDYYMELLWDDRAIAVEQNTGKLKRTGVEK